MFLFCYGSIFAFYTQGIQEVQFLELGIKKVLYLWFTSGYLGKSWGTSWNSYFKGSGLIFNLSGTLQRLLL